MIVKPTRAQRHWTIAVLIALALTGCGTNRDGGPTANPPTAKPISSAAPTPPSKPSVPVGVQPTDLPGLLVDLDGLKKMLNAPTLLKMTTWRHLDTAFGMTIDPPHCAAVVASGLATMFDGSGQAGVLYVNYTTLTPPVFQVGQGVVVFPDAPSAQAFFTEQQTSWQQCSNSDVTVSSPDGPNKQTVGQPQTTAGVLSVTITATQGIRCAHTMAVRSNVVTDNFACSTALADQTTDITNAILDKVH